MASFDFGPVEFYLVELADDRPADSVISALDDLVSAGTVRVLDFLIVTVSEDGEQATSVEAEGATLAVPGLIGEEDVADFADELEPGRSAAIVALELVWARTLAERVSAAGAQVLRVERIPAPVVNALFDEFEDAE